MVACYAGVSFPPAAIERQVRSSSPAPQQTAEPAALPDESVTAAASRVAEARRAALLEFEQMRIELQGEATKARLAVEVQVTAVHLALAWQAYGIKVHHSPQPHFSNTKTLRD